MLQSNLELGIDLDNTIIDYSEVLPWVAKKTNIVEKSWSGSKLALRNTVRSIQNGEFLWQKIQGLAYGKYIYKARLFPGALRFLWFCKQRGIKVEIVSHKTKFAHHDDENYNLRNQALQFLKLHGLYENKPTDLISSLTFCNTQKAKIDVINKKGFTIFIDDLIEIFENQLFPSKTQFILFNPDENHINRTVRIASSWPALEEVLIGNYKYSELKKLCKTLKVKNAHSFQRINSGINSKVYEFCNHEKKMILKIYTPDNRYDRLTAERSALNLLCQSGFVNVPKILGEDRVYSIIALQHIYGNKVLQPTKEMIVECCEFIKDIQKIANSLDLKEIQIAKDACFSVAETMDSIHLRRNKFESIDNQQLIHFLKREFDPITEKIKKTIYGKLTPSDRVKVMGIKSRILSPSDFGFHNILVDPKNKLNFIDFEYFGWDNPVKLLVDFILHPGFILGYDEKMIWIKNSLTSYAQGLEEDLNLTWPLFGLLWVLILLNNFKTVSDNESSNKVNSRQLDKAKSLLLKIEVSFDKDFKEAIVDA